ncbi:hypothetical protein MMC12_008694 [Toensbergia leucococca]|nr:hypothetical protein [Toensbergia leucococca]
MSINAPSISNISIKSVSYQIRPEDNLAQQARRLLVMSDDMDQRVEEDAINELTDSYSHLKLAVAKKPQSAQAKNEGNNHTSFQQPQGKTSPLEAKNERDARISEEPLAAEADQGQPCEPLEAASRRIFKRAEKRLADSERFEANARDQERLKNIQIEQLEAARMAEAREQRRLLNIAAREAEARERERLFDIEKERLRAAREARDQEAARKIELQEKLKDAKNAFSNRIFAEAREQERLRNKETERLRAAREASQAQAREQARLTLEAERSRRAEEKLRHELVRTTAWKTWSASCESLSDPSALTRFPDPPTYGCKMPTKRQNACLKGDHLQACHHELEWMLRGSGQYCHDFVRQLTFKFHPDKFSACPDAVRAKMEGKAKDMFQMLRKLMEVEK